MIIFAYLSIPLQSTMYGATNQCDPSNVQRLFSMVDRDGSGHITANELKSALANGQGDTFSTAACELLIGMLYEKHLYFLYN